MANIDYAIQGNKKDGYTVTVNYDGKFTKIWHEQMSDAQDFVIKLMVNMGEIGC